MDIIYLLLPVALIIVIVIIAVFFWAVKSDQFDDLEGPAHRILMDDDQVDKNSHTDLPGTPAASENNKQKK
ncbi:MAG: cbb3-type cytochrome oxidase assembly protein CcoS [Gammaproteobacteria bacterium]|nr:cbb3-type cytochrome oxidase assembly protein CcoS [Gammaproteobacteria bacterium]